MKARRKYYNWKFKVDANGEEFASEEERKRIQEERKKAVDNMLSPTHQKHANRLLQVLTSLGGVYVKFGQEISMMKGMLPPEYPRTLRVLQDGLPCHLSREDISRMFENEIGKPLDEVFDEFDEQPIAAASLAQVC